MPDARHIKPKVPEPVPFTEYGDLPYSQHQFAVVSNWRRWLQILLVLIIALTLGFSSWVLWKGEVVIGDIVLTRRMIDLGASESVQPPQSQVAPTATSATDSNRFLFFSPGLMSGDELLVVSTGGKIEQRVNLGVNSECSSRFIISPDGKYLVRSNLIAELDIAKTIKLTQFNPIIGEGTEQSGIEKSTSNTYATCDSLDYFNVLWSKDSQQIIFSQIVRSDVGDSYIDIYRASTPSFTPSKIYTTKHNGQISAQMVGISPSADTIYVSQAKLVNHHVEESLLVVDVGKPAAVREIVYETAAELAEPAVQSQVAAVGWSNQTQKLYYSLGEVKKSYDPQTGEYKTYATANWLPSDLPYGRYSQQPANGEYEIVVKANNAGQGELRLQSQDSHQKILVEKDQYIHELQYDWSATGKKVAVYKYQSLELQIYTPGESELAKIIGLELPRSAVFVSWIP